MGKHKHTPRDKDGNVTNWRTIVLEYIKSHPGERIVTSLGIAKTFGIGLTTASSALANLVLHKELVTVGRGRRREVLYALPNEVPKGPAVRTPLSSAPSFATVNIGEGSRGTEFIVTDIDHKRKTLTVEEVGNIGHKAAAYAIDGAIEKLSHALAQLIEARRRISG